LSEAAAAMLTVVQAAIDAAIGPLSWEKVYLSPGDPADDCTGPVLTCQVVDVGLNTSVGGGQGDAAYQRRRQGTFMPMADLAVRYVNCLPTGRDSLPAALLTEVAHGMYRSLWASVNAIIVADEAETLFDLEQVVGFSLGLGVPVNPSGGVTGWVIPWSVELDGYQV
jgi:hypothetical protein